MFRLFISVAREKKQEAHRCRAYSSKSWRTHDRTGSAGVDAFLAYYPESVAQTQKVEGFVAQMRHFERPRTRLKGCAHFARRKCAIERDKATERIACAR